MSQLDMQQQQIQFIWHRIYSLVYIRKHKNKHKIFPLFIFSTLRLHRVTDVALRGIYICILFTAYFDVFIFTWSKRSLKNTVLRTNQNSKWVQNFRKRYSLMTLMTNSSQCNIPQCKYPSFILCWTYIFFGNKASLNQPTAEKKRNCVPFVFNVCTDWDTQSCSHNPYTYKQVHVFDGETIRESRVCSGLA